MEAWSFLSLRTIFLSYAVGAFLGALAGGAAVAILVGTAVYVVAAIHPANVTTCPFCGGASPPRHPLPLLHLRPDLTTVVACTGQCVGIDPIVSCTAAPAAPTVGGARPVPEPVHGRRRYTPAAGGACPGSRSLRERLNRRVSRAPLSSGDARTISVVVLSGDRRMTRPPLTSRAKTATARTRDASCLP